MHQRREKGRQGQGENGGEESSLDDATARAECQVNTRLVHPTALIVWVLTPVLPPHLIARALIWVDDAESISIFEITLP